MRILFLTNLIPYPLDNGGKIKSFNTLKMLSGKDNKIDIFSFYETNAEKDSVNYMKTLFNEVNVIKKPLTTSVNMKIMMGIAIKSLFNKLPFVLLKYKDNEMSALLKRKIEETKYDLIYIDHLQLGVYFEILKEANCPIYLDQHNCESQILKRKIGINKNILKNIFIKIEYNKLKKFEDGMIEKCDKVIVLSQEDKLSLLDGKRINDEKFVIIPIPIQVDYMKRIGSEIKDTINILFLGTLSWFPNEQGIEWFVDNVIPNLDKVNINYNLYIVGKDPSENLINKCKNKKNIKITGYVDDVNVYIEKCDIMIAPIFVGSGMRVKILEGIGKRIPIISTTIGAEGIEVEDKRSILIANKESEFIDSIVALTDKELYYKIQVNSEKIFNERYSLEAVKKKYKKNVLDIRTVEC